MKLLTALLGLSLVVTASAQQRREPLTVVVALASASEGQAAVLVRVYNRAWRTVNLFVPNRLTCTAAPGTVTLEWKYKGDVANSNRAVQGIETLCPHQPSSLEGSPALENAAAQGGHWMHLAPGAYVEVRDTIQTGGLIEGRYEVRPIYTAPRFDSDERSQLRYAGIETAKGQYSGKEFPWELGATP